MWLVGPGSIGKCYARVLSALDIRFQVIGRGVDSAKRFREATGIEVLVGGIENVPAEVASPTNAIVAVSMESLASTVRQLVDRGVKRILVEKPAGLRHEVESLAEYCDLRKVEVFVAYNRRFYASVSAAQVRIKDDGGLSSFSFDFTELSHIVAKSPRSASVKQEWFWANSSHVVDLAFFLGGWPDEITTFQSGELAWHPSGSRFTGAGISEKGALFSYHANWAAPGRWGLELRTERHRFVLRPLEMLRCQRIGELQATQVPLEDAWDTEFKPGLYRQVRAFLKGRDSRLVSLLDHSRHKKIFDQICIEVPMSG